MPVVVQGGLAHFALDVRNGSGVFTDPTNLTMTFKDSLGVDQAGFPIAYPGAILKDAVGQYHFDWIVPVLQTVGTYASVWNAILLGAAAETQELWQIELAGSLSVGGLDFMIAPDDYDAVRGLLGVTTLDVEDSDINLMVFAPHAELLVKNRISNWATQMTDNDQLYVLRLATVYRTACLMAESWVRGGTIGLARPLSTGEGRDWADAAKQFCDGYDYWINIADASDEGTESTSIYTIDPVKVGGPTSTAVAHRRGRLPGEAWSWMGFPPHWNE